MRKQSLSWEPIAASQPSNPAFRRWKPAQHRTHAGRPGRLATGHNIRDASGDRGRNDHSQGGLDMADKVCLVCNKAIAEGKDMKWNHEGKWLVFDDMGCRNRFIGNPKKYLDAASA